jgi:hypothetical protein
MLESPISINSQFLGANVGEDSCVAEYADVQYVIVETVEFWLVPS